ncbi:MAG: thermonuclease family protein [Egibacteraceae bacterium]
MLISGCVPVQRTGEPALSGLPPEAQPAVVTRVIDGDTIWVRPQLGGEELRVRLLEIDAPETSRDHGGPECYGAQATTYAEEQLAVGSVVLLAADQEDTDRFGRALRYVWTDDGTFFNQEAVRQGYARTVLYEPNNRFIHLLRAAEAEARFARRGLWSC